MAMLVTTAIGEVNVRIIGDAVSSLWFVIVDSVSAVVRSRYSPNCNPKHGDWFVEKRGGTVRCCLLTIHV